MRRLFPNRFGLREGMLALLAVVMAVISGFLTWAAGMGAGVAWMIFTFIGTVILIVVAGSDRCFYTALFTSLLVTSLMAPSIYFDGFPAGREGIIQLFISSVFILLPVGFAWLVTKIVKYARRDA